MVDENNPQNKVDDKSADKIDGNSDDKKLKSLEKALAQELDQKVSFGAATDIRLSGDIDVNPILSAPIKEPEKKNDDKIIVTGSPGSSEEEKLNRVVGGSQAEPENISVGGAEDADDKVLSLEELDKIFDESGPEFRAGLESIREEVKKVADGKNIEEATVVEDGDLKSLDDVSVGESAPEEPWPPGIEKVKAVIRNLRPQKIKKNIQEFKQDLPNKIQRLKKEFFPWLKKKLKFLWGKTLEILKMVSAVLLKGLKWFLALEMRMKLMLGFIFLSLIGLLFTIRLTMKGGVLPPDKNVLIGDLGEQADEVFKIEKNSEWNSFQDPVYLPDFSVGLNRIVVNIKKSQSSSRNPMMVFEVIISTSNQEAAVEIKTRLPEVRDLISRVSEEITYDDLVTVEGKEKLKLVIRRELNQTLATGRVQKILFKSLVVKP